MSDPTKPETYIPPNDDGEPDDAAPDLGTVEGADREAAAAEFDAIMRGEDPPAPVAGDRAQAAPPVAAPGAPPVAGDEEPEVVRQIRAREQAQKIRDAATEDGNTYRVRIITEAKTEAARIVAEERAKFDAERSQWSKQLKEDPLAAINAAGMDKKALLDGVIKSDDPVFIARQAEARAKALEEQIAELRQAPNKQFDQWRQQQEQAQQQQAVAATERAWVDTMKAELPESYAQAEQAAASMRAMGWESITLPSGQVVPVSADTVLIQRGYIESRKVSDMLGLPQNQVAPVQKVVQYLKHQSKQAGAAVGSAAQTSVGRVNGSRTVNNAAASERRSATKADAELTREERRALAAQEFDAIMAAERRSS